jgi:3-hydroxybutyryl-CoA dehydrogenase
MMKVAVIGSGVMGSGIAISSILKGYKTLVFDIHQNQLEKSQSYIQKQLQQSCEKGRITEEQMNLALSHLEFSTEFDDLKADFIIEAILEQLPLKQELFEKLEAINPAETIFATNTSSIPITQIASKLKNPERVVGVHFFNPAHIMKLVEVISGAATSKLIAEKAFNWAESLGKTVVYAQDAPGFIVNRVARHYYVESLKIMEESVADFEGIDALLESTGFKMGPFRLMDLIGVDTNYSVTKSMFEQFNFDSKFRPSRIQKQKVDAGFHGQKSGKGFYDYEKK